MPAATSVISKREIPKDLQGIQGLSRGFTPPPVERCRIVIAGLPGAGKSTFLNSFPNALVLDPEHGGATVANPQALRWDALDNTPLDQLDKAYVAFMDMIVTRKRNGANDIQTIGIDSLDKLISIFQKSLCLRNNLQDVGDYAGGHGKGYFVVRDTVFGMLDKVYRAGMGWAVIARTMMKTVEGDQQVMDYALSNSYRAALFQECEHLLGIERGTETINIPGKTIKMPGGKVKKGPPRTEQRPVRLLRTGVLNRPEDKRGALKVRLPFPDRIVLPEENGFGTWSEAYDCAVRTLTNPKEK